MSRIRYTPGGDYDRHDSIGITPIHKALYYVKPEQGEGDLFEAYDRHNNLYTLPADWRTDGIYADLSDSHYDCLMQGGAQGDVLICGPYWNYVYGGGGDDVIRGGTGVDILSGDAGADHLYGGSGPDTFSFYNLSDFGSRERPDVLEDFSGASGQGDVIDLEQLGSFTFIGAKQFHGNGDGELRAVADKTGYLVQGDSNGDAQIDFLIQVNSSQPLTAGDFEWFSNSPVQSAFTHLRMDHAYAPANGAEHLAIA